jgi:Asp/Glu/hydantoin racemase
MFQRFAVITSESAVVGEIEAAARSYGVAGHLGAVESVGIPAGDVPGRAEETFSTLQARAERLPADTSGIVLGCTELAEFAAPLERVLRERGRPLVSVVNPIAVAVRWVEMHLAARAASTRIP